MSIDVARRILEASKQRAKELRSPVSIAIVDAGGHLVLFERMMAPYGWATGSISIAKATTAVMFNQSTDAVAGWGSGIPGFASSMAAMYEGKFIMAAGGWPIKLNGATVGGIGVSGGNAPGRDDEIARAGLGALDVAPPSWAAPQQQQPLPQQQQSYASPSYQQMPPNQPGVPQPLPNRSTMQPTPSYPPMPLPNNNVGSQQEFPPSTQSLPPERPEDAAYGDETASYNQYNSDNYSGGQKT
ncbi:MAG: GlcG/HbpS family heme-binding protein [Ktedonobacteraceae bacterium]